MNSGVDHVKDLQLGPLQRDLFGFGDWCFTIVVQGLEGAAFQEEVNR